MKRKFLINVIMIILILSMTVVPTVHADEGYSESYGNSTIYMHDLGNLLTDEEEERLIEKFGMEASDINYNILFLTTNDANNKSTMVYSEDYMDSLFPSYKHNIAFIIDIDNREIYINTMGNAIKCLTDNMIDKALDKGYNYITDYEYAKCLDAMAEYCVSRLNDNPGEGAIDTNLSVNGFGETLLNGMGSGILPGAIVTAILVFVLISKHNSANKVQSASTYVSRENYEINDKKEVFVRSYDTIQRDYYKPSSSSSSGSRSRGGSSHRSSSGRSHGGGGRRF